MGPTCHWVKSFFSHPPHRGHDAKEMRALVHRGQRPHGREGATSELRTGESAQRWRSRVEGGSAVVEIDDGGKWTRLRLYSVEVIATPHRMRAEVLGQTGMGFAREIWVPTPNWGL